MPIYKLNDQSSMAITPFKLTEEKDKKINESILKKHINNDILDQSYDSVLSYLDFRLKNVNNLYGWKKLLYLIYKDNNRNLSGKDIEKLGNCVQLILGILHRNSKLLMDEDDLNSKILLRINLLILKRLISLLLTQTNESNIMTINFDNLLKNLQIYKFSIISLIYQQSSFLANVDDMIEMISGDYEEVDLNNLFYLAKHAVNSESNKLIFYQTYQKTLLSEERYSILLKSIRYLIDAINKDGSVKKEIIERLIFGDVIDMKWLTEYEKWKPIFYFDDIPLHMEDRLKVSLKYDNRNKAEISEKFFPKNSLSFYIA
ncbi:hypothetical protein SNEBB_008571 [Seison nebaliae]|nr:hypothetical protein SNEBB_008571 [Seison nebaliae]